MSLEEKIQQVTAAANCSAQQEQLVKDAIQEDKKQAIAEHAQRIYDEICTNIASEIQKNKSEEVSGYIVIKADVPNSVIKLIRKKGVATPENHLDVINAWHDYGYHAGQIERDDDCYAFVNLRLFHVTTNRTITFWTTRTREFHEFVPYLSWNEFLNKLKSLCSSDNIAIEPKLLVWERSYKKKDNREIKPLNGRIETFGQVDVIMTYRYSK